MTSTLALGKRTIRVMIHRASWAIMGAGVLLPPLAQAVATALYKALS